MNRKDLIFVAIAVAVIGLFIFLSLIGREATPLSPRPEHAGMSLETPRETCVGCHTPDSEVWLRHPKRGKPPDQTTPCSACHKFPNAALEAWTKKKEGRSEWRSRLER